MPNRNKISVKSERDLTKDVLQDAWEKHPITTQRMQDSSRELSEAEKKLINSLNLPRELSEAEKKLINSLNLQRSSPSKEKDEVRSGTVQGKQVPSGAVKGPKLQVVTAGPNKPAYLYRL